MSLGLVGAELKLTRRRLCCTAWSSRGLERLGLGWLLEGVSVLLCLLVKLHNVGTSQTNKNECHDGSAKHLIFAGQWLREAPQSTLNNKALLCVR